MKILGINSHRAAPKRFDPEWKRKLADGSAALLQDGQIKCAAIEERFTRIRYSAGYRISSLACLDEGGITIEDLDAVGHSTCADIAWSDPVDVLEDIAESWDGIFHEDRILRALEGKVFTVDHHESHASLAFVGSGFTRALVVVFDGLGNRVDPNNSFEVSQNWWRGAFERQTYYLCEWYKGRIHFEKVHEDAHRVDEIGLGELYRSVTHFLGWDTYQHAGKTMALAPFGNPDRLKNARFVEFVPPHSIRVPVQNLHYDPIEQIGNVLSKAGYDLPDSVGSSIGSPDDRFLCDVAAVVQNQLETAIIDSVCRLADKYAVKDIAFGGGVAMNCVALGKLARTMPELNFYIPPAPSDTGQGLGNALWLAYSERSPVCETKPASPIRTAALGVSYPQHGIDKTVSAYLEKHPCIKGSKISDAMQLASAMTDRLLENKVIGLRQGRAEYGPRALGQASIIADARTRDMHDIVNSFKRREPFRPYAPSILNEFITEYFDISVPSPFMSFAGTFREDKLHIAPAVVHVDGTARYQSVDGDVGFFRQLLETYYRRTGIPIILNTSFNLNGEPIVETPEDALNCFERSGMTDLVLGDWYLQRK